MNPFLTRHLVIKHKCIKSNEGKVSPHYITPTKITYVVLFGAFALCAYALYNRPKKTKSVYYNTEFTGEHI